MQVTVATSFFKKLDLLQEKLEQGVKDKASDIVSEAVDLSPVDTGAFVESWQINPRGERTARSRSAVGRPKLPEGSKQTKREEEKSRLLSRVESFDLEQLTGFTVTNRAPHIAEMNKSDRLKTGLSPSEIQAVLKDRFR
jgi:hypothetical protein|tara:strand:- start:40 stop:456 length:417 start_codon:yes stop_codon:yes gene_type:complete